SNSNGESAATAAARAKLKTAEALLAQKRLYQRQLRSLQQTALARELMTSVRQRGVEGVPEWAAHWLSCRPRYKQLLPSTPHHAHALLSLLLGRADPTLLLPAHAYFAVTRPRDEAAPPHATTTTTPTHATQELHSRFLQLSLTLLHASPPPHPQLSPVVGREGGQDSPTPPPTPTTPDHTTPPLHRPCSPLRSRSPPASLSLPLYLPSPAKTSPSLHHTTLPPQSPPSPVTYAPPPRRALISFSVESIIGKQS
ncbi:hypothetical protein Pcinc_003935, partial [Petrolisthes cinctipes]